MIDSSTILDLLIFIFILPFVSKVITDIQRNIVNVYAPELSDEEYKTLLEKLVPVIISFLKALVKKR